MDIIKKQNKFLAKKERILHWPEFAIGKFFLNNIKKHNDPLDKFSFCCTTFTYALQCGNDSGIRENKNNVHIYNYMYIYIYLVFLILHKQYIFFFYNLTI